MWRYVIFVSLLSFFLSEVSAQSSFLPGYYITSKSDTVRGYIQYQDLNSDRSTCIFKDGLIDQGTILLPEKIKGFVITNSDMYESHIYKTVNGQDYYGFFRTIVGGKIRLLTFRNDFYAVDGQGKMSAMSRHPALERVRIFKDSYGVGVLKGLVKDCPSVSTQVRKRYKKKEDAADILEDYNKCIGQNAYRGTIRTVEPRFRFGLSGSVAFTQIDYGDGNFKDAKFKQKLVPQFGIYASMAIPNSKARLMGEILYGQNKTYSYFQKSNINNDYFLQYSYLRIPVYMRYYFSMFFFDIGLQDQVLVSQKLQWRKEIVNGEKVVTDNGNPDKLPTQTIGGLVGAGFRLRVGTLIVQPGVRLSRQFSIHSDNPQYQSLEFNLKIGK